MTIRTDIPETSEVTIGGTVYRQVNFPPGAKRTHRINNVDSAGSAQNMGGWSLAYVWRDERGNIVVSKATGGSGITIGNGSGTNDRATVTIDRTDTVSLRGRYRWALWRTDGTDDDLLAEGTVVVPAVADQP